MEIEYLLSEKLGNLESTDCFSMSFPNLTSRPSNVCLRRSGKYVVQYQKMKITTGVLKGTRASEIEIKIILASRYWNLGIKKI